MIVRVIYRHLELIGTPRSRTDGSSIVEQDGRTLVFNRVQWSTSNNAGCLVEELL